MHHVVMILDLKQTVLKQVHDLYLTADVVGNHYAHHCLCPPWLCLIKKAALDE